MANSPDWVLCWLAAARIGALTVPISTLYQPGTVMVLEHSDIDTLLVVDHYLNHDYIARLETVAELVVGPAESVRAATPVLASRCRLGTEERQWS